MTRVPAVLAAAWLASPATAWACAVCGGGAAEASRFAFMWTTAFLSFLPLGLIGGVCYVVWRRARALG